MEQEDDTQQRILQTTMAMLVEQDSSQLRTRQIAEKAGVNIATIHYYFRTKDALIQEALNTMTYAGLQEMVAQMLDFDQLTREQVKVFFRHLLVMLAEHPTISRNRLVISISGAEDKSTLSLANTLRKIIKTLRPDISDGMLKVTSAQWSAVLAYACILQTQQTTYPGLDLTDETCVDNFIEQMLKQIEG